MAIRQEVDLEQKEGYLSWIWSMYRLFISYLGADIVDGIDNPIGPFEPAVELLRFNVPKIGACVHIYPGYNRMQKPLHRAYFGGTDVRTSGSRMPVERGEGHLIKVDESEFGDSTLLAR